MPISAHNAPLPDEKLVELMHFANRLADAAATVTLASFRTAVDVDYKIKGDDHFDPVTEADRNAEKAIRTLIEEKYPQHAILGEEFGHKKNDSPFEWVLDPIDGTRAFISGLPTWGTLIALTYHGTPIIGIIDQPYMGERFAGSRLGATLNGSPIQTRKCQGLETATLASTDPGLFEGNELAAFNQMLAATRLVRYGLDCYAYAVLSTGFIDIVLESGLKPYDMMALIPVIQGAGGVAVNWHGGTAGPDGRLLALGDPALLSPALQVLKNA